MNPSPCIAIIGSGGKTTAMLTLAKACPSQRVLVTTTTHIYPVSPPESRELLVNPDPEQLQAALSRPGIVCAGMAAKEGKLSGLPEDLFSQGRSWADLTLCEADGSRQHPLKLHKEGEPVIPAGCDLFWACPPWDRRFPRRCIAGSYAQRGRKKLRYLPKCCFSAPGRPSVLPACRRRIAWCFSIRRKGLRSLPPPGRFPGNSSRKVYPAGLAV